jgi:hypothetical protein
MGFCGDLTEPLDRPTLSLLKIPFGQGIGLPMKAMVDDVR